MSGGNAAPVSLLLNYNSLAEAAVAHFAECCQNGMSKKQILLQLQSVCASYACQGVKRNGGLTDSKKKLQAATVAYRDVVVPGFLAWLNELEGSPLTLPRWVNRDIMGCSNVGGEGKKGEPRFYNDTNKVWGKHTADYLVLRRDINPAYDKVTAGQPEGQPPSGQQYPDQLSELLDELWITQCKQSGKTREVVDVEEETQFLAPTSSQSARPATVQEGDGERASPATVQPVSGEKAAADVTATNGGAVEAGGGGAAVAASGGDLGPEPDEDSPEYPLWLARQAAVNNKAADAGSSTGTSSTSPDASSKYPERPSNWMHQLTLTFCFFGRPAGKDEDTELATAMASSGPPSRGRKRKKVSVSGSEGGSSGGGASDEGSSSSDNPLNAGAVRQFVGAGEAQSRAKVKKATAEVQLQESRETIRKQFLQQTTEQTQYSKKMLEAVERVADNTTAQRALDEEEACRKRKKQVIDDLKVQLEYCEPGTEAGFRALLMSNSKKPVNEFTAAYVAGGTDNVPCPSAPQATSAGPALPGFSQNISAVGSAGGGTTAQSGVAAGSAGAHSVIRV